MSDSSSFNADLIYAQSSNAKRWHAEVAALRAQVDQEEDNAKEEGRKLAQQILEAVKGSLDSMLTYCDQGVQEEAERRNGELSAMVQSANSQRRDLCRELKEVTEEYKEYSQRNPILRDQVSTAKKSLKSLKQEEEAVSKEVNELEIAYKVERVLLAQITRCLRLRPVDSESVECDVIVKVGQQETVPVKLTYREEGLSATEVDSNWQRITQLTGVKLEAICSQFPELSAALKRNDWIDARETLLEGSETEERCNRGGGRMGAAISPRQKTKSPSRVSIQL